jgi:hypothetical protein
MDFKLSGNYTATGNQDLEPTQVASLMPVDALEPLLSAVA